MKTIASESLDRTVKITTAEYSRLGYEVVTCRNGRVISEYHAGNSPADSHVQTTSRFALPLRKIRSLAISTARDICRELKSEFGGVERVNENDLCA